MNMATGSSKQVEGLPGLCIIVDRTKTGNTKDKETTRDLFDFLGYKVNVVQNESHSEVRAELEKIAQAISKPQTNYKCLVLVIFGKLDPGNISYSDYNQKLISDDKHNSDVYLDLFNEEKCPSLKGKKQILIQHLWYSSDPPTKDESENIQTDPSVTVKLEKERIFRAFSTLTDKNDKHKDHHPLFIDSMDRILRKFAATCDINDLFTKVCRNVEITQYRDNNYGKTEQTSDNKVKHTATFDYNTFGCKKQTGFYMRVSKDSSTSPMEVPPISPMEVDQSNENMRKNYLPEEPDTSHLMPGQYNNIPVLSRRALKKIPSMNIEMKRQKLPKNMDKYPMDKLRRGFCLIINISNNRSGSFVDELKMHQLFTELYFETRIINNQAHDDIQTEVEQLASQISDDHQCLVVILLAHGEENKANKQHMFMDIRGEKRDSSYVFDYLLARSSLHRKPKFYIIQTCFGKECMMPVVSGDEHEKTPGEEEIVECEETVEMDDAESDNSGTLKDDSVPTRTPVSVPHVKSDTYRIHATIEGYKSYRSTTEGTFLIQAIDETFRDYAADHHLSSLMTIVTDLVTARDIKDKEKKQHVKQLPESKSHTFRGFLFFNPGYIASTNPTLPDLSQKTIHTASIIWTADQSQEKQTVALASRTNSWIKIHTLGSTDGEKIYEPYPTTFETEIKGITAGFQLDTTANKHIITYTTHTGDRKTVEVTLDPDTKTWSKTRDLPINDAINICEINLDGFAVLCGKPSTTDDTTIEIYTRDSVAKSPIQMVDVIRLNYGKSSIRDQLCYWRSKFYISSFYESTIHKVNLNAKIIEKFVGTVAFEPNKGKHGEMYKPIALFRGIDGSIDVACYDAIHTNIFGESQGTVKSLDNLTPNYMWYNDQNVVIAHDAGLKYCKFTLLPKDIAKITFSYSKTVKFPAWNKQAVWRTQNPNIIAAGGAETTAVSLVTSDGDALLTKHLGVMGRITCGLWLYNNTHIVLIDDGSNTTAMLISIDVDVDINTITSLPEAQQLPPFLNKPYAVLEIDDVMFGIVCTDNITRKTTVEIRERKNPGTRAKSVSLQMPETACFGKSNDSGCVDTNGEFYLASQAQGIIYHFDIDGSFIGPIHAKDNKPYKVMVDVENTLYVLSQSGLYRRHDNEWKRIFRPTSANGEFISTWDVCWNTDYDTMYSVHRTELTIYKKDTSMEQ